MTGHDCDRSALLALWLGELDEEAAERVDEHLFACDDCARWLEELAAVQDALAELVESGRLVAATTDSTLARARLRGVRLRTYSIPPGGTVHCTIAPDDDANVVRLSGPFADADSVSLVSVQREGGAVVAVERRDELPIDRRSGELVLLYAGEAIRSLPRSTFELEALARGPDGGDRLLGRYTLEHSPWED